jgi:Uma2 family endonuclease
MQTFPVVGVAPEHIRRFTVAEYHRLVEAGILRDDDPVELIQGFLVTKMVRNPRHDLGVSLTEEALSRVLPEPWFCRVQSAVTTADSEPEPDVAIVRGPRRRYATSHPSASDVALIVEVADASLQRDRSDKASLYAAAGIPSYWILNLVDGVLEVHETPDSGTRAYGKRRVLGGDATVDVVLPGGPAIAVRVANLLP